MTSKKFENIEIKHTEFNAQRTLRTSNPSLFVASKLGQLMLLKDANVPFANQILRLNQQSILNLNDALEIYECMSMSPYLEVKHDDLTDDLKQHLHHLKFEIVETLNFLSIHCQDIHPATPQIKVKRLLPQDADMFLTLLKTSGMQCDDDIWQLKKHLYCTERFRCYIAKIDGHPRALATTFIEGQQGLLANAFTQAKFQNMGCQTALLTIRMQDAKNLGLTELIVDVVPNTASERNCLKLGFKPLETRYIWQKTAK